MRAQLTSIIFSFALPATVAAGPFGFELDAKPPSEFCSETETKMIFKCSSAPNPHSQMEFYTVKYADGIGVCMIKGVGIDIKDNGYGLSTKAKADNLSEQLSSKYGPPTEIKDILLPGSIWDEPEDYMMSLIKKDRYSWHHWELNSSDFEGLAEIFLAPQALSRDKGYIAIEFLTASYERCNEVASQSDAESF